MTTATRPIDHTAADAAHAALLGALAARAAVPRDADFERYTGHPMDPRTPDEDTLTADEAEEQAADEVLTTTEPLADWIAKKCDCDQGRAPIDTTKFDDVDLIDCDRVPVLLACLLGGDEMQMHAASNRLRTLFLQAERKTIGQRAAQLLAGAL